MKKVLILILFLVVLSCDSKKSISVYTTREVLLEKYVNSIDSLPWFDSSDYHYQLLKAYLRNDTVHLKKTIQEISDEIELEKQKGNNLTCPQPSEIDTYNFDEVYRFEYRAVFCDQKSNLTIGIRNDSFQLFGYQYKVPFGTDSCISFQKIEKRLTREECSVIGTALYQSDIWGLKLGNGNSGFDGSTLVVTAYRKRPYSGPNFTKIARWSPEKTALGQTFLKVLKIASIKPSCYSY